MSCPHAYVPLQRSIVVSKSSTFCPASWSSVPCTLSYLNARSGPSYNFMKTPQSKVSPLYTQSNSVTQSHMFRCKHLKQKLYTVYTRDSHACSTATGPPDASEYTTTAIIVIPITRELVNPCYLAVILAELTRRAIDCIQRMVNIYKHRAPSIYTNNDKNLLLRVSFYNKCASKQISGSVLLCVRLNYRERMRTNGDVLESFGVASN